MTVRHLLLTISLAAAIPAAVMAQTSTTTTSTRTFQFQPVGLGSTETAQINVYNSAANSSSGTAASCTGSISFLNASGTAIGSAASFTITSGEVFSAKLPFASSGGSGIRTIVIGAVTSTFTSGTPCSLTTTFETYDSTTGATHVELGGAAERLGDGGGPGGFGH